MKLFIPFDQVIGPLTFNLLNTSILSQLYKIHSGKMQYQNSENSVISEVYLVIEI